MSFDYTDYTTTSLTKVGECGVCGQLYPVIEIEKLKGYSKAINDYLCLECQHAVAIVRSRKRALWVK